MVRQVADANALSHWLKTVLPVRVIGDQMRDLVQQAGRNDQCVRCTETVTGPQGGRLLSDGQVCDSHA